MVTSEEEARKLIFKPNFRHRKKFTDNFFAFHMKKRFCDIGIEVGVNKKVIGMFKDECGGKQITEFVSLRSKQHSFKI